MERTPRSAGSREWIGLSVLALPTLLVSMDMSILFLAAPSLSAALRPSSAELLWISDIYGFMLAGALIPMGALGDRFGRRRLLLFGALFFGLASVLAAFATSAAMLIGARALLGIAGATLLPSTLAILRNMFEVPRQRSVAIGIWTACFTLGGVLGPIVGGVLLEVFWWGSVFLVGVPLMLALLLLGPLFLPEFAEPSEHPIDMPGIAQAVFSLLALTWALKQFAENGLTATAAFSLFAGLGVGAWFLRRQARLAAPLLDLDLFRNVRFSAALAANSLALFAWVGASLLVAQYLQLVIGLSPLSAGLWTVPAAVGSVVGCLGAAALARRLSSSRVVCGALLLTSTGLALMAVLPGRWGMAAIISGMVMLGTAVAIIITLGTDLVLAAAPPDRAGAAAAISETGADLGGSLGVAVLGSIGIAVYRASILLPSGIGTEASGAARDTLGGAMDIAAGMGPEVGAQLRLSAQSAFTSGFAAAMGAGAILLLTAAALFAWTAFRGRGARRIPRSEEA